MVELMRVRSKSTWLADAFPAAKLDVDSENTQINKNISNLYKICSPLKKYGSFPLQGQDDDVCYILLFTFFYCE